MNHMGYTCTFTEWIDEALPIDGLQRRGLNQHAMNIIPSRQSCVAGALSRMGKVVSVGAIV